MRLDTVYKTVHQYNSVSVSPEDMKKLLEIAKGYCMVKNYVYQRFGGIGSLSKLYPGYTVQNELTKSGLREEWGLPSVYFYLALFDALGDIKSQWGRTKAKLLALVGRNENLEEEEKHYLRFVLRVGNAFEAVLAQEPVRLGQGPQEKYDALAAQVDTGKMRRYLCRQVRKYHAKLHTGQASGFSASERAYRYGDHGIYLSTKESRKRVFIPLTDSNQFKSQLYIKLYPEESRLEIKAAIHVAVRSHEDYTNQVGLAMGMFTMLTTDRGNRYGEELGEYQTAYAEWIRGQTASYNRNRADNPGRKKYRAKKNRMEEQMHSYINHELNRFLETERPEAVYMAKLPRQKVGGVSPKINNSVSMWQRGYIRKRLTQKCREQSIRVVEVFGKGISRECSRCGAAGVKKGGVFSCGACGYTGEEKTNTAGSVLRRGLGKDVFGRNDHKGEAWIGFGGEPRFYRKDQAESP